MSWVAGKDRELGSFKNWSVSSNQLRKLVLFAFILLFSAAFAVSPNASPIAAHDVEIDGVKLHYMTAGHGPALILLHGYAETSRMWRPIIPSLAERFTVIAPDLPGIGDSGIPADGLDMKTAAIRIHDLSLIHI